MVKADFRVWRSARISRRTENFTRSRPSRLMRQIRRISVIPSSCPLGLCAANQTLICEWTVSSDPNVANTTSPVLMRINHPQSNHQGGELAFGPDGDLYFSLGDGGGGNDNNGGTAAWMVTPITSATPRIPASCSEKFFASIPTVTTAPRPVRHPQRQPLRRPKREKSAKFMRMDCEIHIVSASIQ